MQGICQCVRASSRRLLDALRPREGLHVAPGRTHREDPVVDGVAAAAKHVDDAPVQLLLHRVAHHQQPCPGPLQVLQHLQAEPPGLRRHQRRTGVGRRVSGHDDQNWCHARCRDLECRVLVVAAAVISGWLWLPLHRARQLGLLIGAEGSRQVPSTAGCTTPAHAHTNWVCIPVVPSAASQSTADPVRHKGS